MEEETTRTDPVEHEVIQTMTDPTRWRILKALDGPMTARDVAERVGIQPSNAVYHLKELVRHGVVRQDLHPDYKNRILYRRLQVLAEVLVDHPDAPADVEATLHVTDPQEAE